MSDDSLIPGKKVTELLSKFELSISRSYRRFDFFKRKRIALGLRVGARLLQNETR